MSPLLPLKQAEKHIVDLLTYRYKNKPMGLPNTMSTLEKDSLTKQKTISYNGFIISCLSSEHIQCMIKINDPWLTLCHKNRSSMGNIW